MGGREQSIARRVVRRPRRSKGFLALVLAVSTACAVRTHARPDGEYDSPTPDDALARAAGTRWATEGHRSSLVWPVFADATSRPAAAGDRHSPAEQARLAAAFAAAAGGSVADSVRLRVEREQGPLRPEHVPVQLIAVIAGRDSGAVTLVQGDVSVTGSYDATTLRYLFAADGDGWRFVRREWLGSS